MNEKTKIQIEKSATEFADSMNKRNCSYWIGLRQGFIEGSEIKQMEVDRMHTQMSALVREIEIFQGLLKTAKI